MFDRAVSIDASDRGGDLCGPIGGHRIPLRDGHVTRCTEAARGSSLEIEYLRRDDFQGDVLTTRGARMKGSSTMPCR